MTRVARPVETAGEHELVMFSGRTGATMPRHAHLRQPRGTARARRRSRARAGRTRAGRMMRGDFANMPPGTPHGWTCGRTVRQLALYTMNDRVGAAFVAMGDAAHGAATAGGDAATRLPAASSRWRRLPVTFSCARRRGRCRRADARHQPRAARRRRGRTCCSTAAASGSAATRSSRATRTRTGSSCSSSRRAARAAASARTFTRATSRTSSASTARRSAGRWQGRVAQVRRLLPGTAAQSARIPAHQAYNRFAAFLTPGIFENFFTRGGNGQNGVGGRAVRPPAGRARRRARRCRRAGGPREARRRRGRRATCSGRSR